MPSEPSLDSPPQATTDAPLVSVVVTGYKRPDHLKATLESLLDVVRYPHLELVLADDGSPPEMQQAMRALPFDRFVLADTNRGLGANVNAGLDAARGSFILQLQDDWLCNGPGDFVWQAVGLLAARSTVGLVRFTDTALPDADAELVLETGARARIYRPRADSGTFLYSDHPHLKSRALVDFLGPYQESRYMQRTELDMRDRFNRQTRFEAAFIEGYAAFRHFGEESSHRRPLPVERVGALIDRVPLLRPLKRLLRRVRSPG